MHDIYITSLLMALVVHLSNRAFGQSIDYKVLLFYVRSNVVGEGGD